MTEPATEPEPVDPGHDPGVDPPPDDPGDSPAATDPAVPADPDTGAPAAEAQDRIDDIEEEFGPDAPPRGSLTSPSEPDAAH
jgi:hypothetical protein